MNPAYYGDSYDVVKRFFCTQLTALGYAVFAHPMFTGDWNGAQQEFLRFIGASPAPDGPPPGERTALFLDPDTGVHRKVSSRHVAIDTLADQASSYLLAFAFDQSFPRGVEIAISMREKLAVLAGRGCRAMYYNSHARFLFVSRDSPPLAELRRHVVGLGMPAGRFITGDA